MAKKLTIQQIAQLISHLEGKKKEVDIAQIMEVLKCLKLLSQAQSEVLIGWLAYISK